MKNHYLIGSRVIPYGQKGKIGIDGIFCEVDFVPRMKYDLKFVKFKGKKWSRINF